MEDYDPYDDGNEYDLHRSQGSQGDVDNQLVHEIDTDDDVAVMKHHSLNNIRHYRGGDGPGPGLGPGGQGGGGKHGPPRGGSGSRHTTSRGGVPVHSKVSGLLRVDSQSSDSSSEFFQTTNNNGAKDGGGGGRGSGVTNSDHVNNQRMTMADTLVAMSPSPRHKALVRPPSRQKPAAQHLFEGAEDGLLLDHPLHPLPTRASTADSSTDDVRITISGSQSASGGGGGGGVHGPGGSSSSAQGGGLGPGSRGQPDKRQVPPWTVLITPLENTLLS